MKRVLVVAALSAVLLVVPTRSALALSCPTGQVVWIQAYNSGDGTYKSVSWQGGSRHFAGTGTDYVNTNRQANAYVNIDSDSLSTSVSEFCAPDGVNFA